MLWWILCHSVEIVNNKRILFNRSRGSVFPDLPCGTWDTLPVRGSCHRTPDSAGEDTGVWGGSARPRAGDGAYIWIRGLYNMLMPTEIGLGV